MDGKFIIETCFASQPACNIRSMQLSGVCRMCIATAVTLRPNWRVFYFPSTKCRLNRARWEFSWTNMGVLQIRRCTLNYPRQLFFRLSEYCSNSTIIINANYVTYVQHSIFLTIEYIKPLNIIKTYYSYLNITTPFNINAFVTRESLVWIISSVYQAYLGHILIRE